MGKKREKLVQLRKKKGLTHDQIAIKLNISRSYYTMIENGTRNPSLELALKISKEVNGDPSEIFFRCNCNDRLQDNATCSVNKTA